MVHLLKRGQVLLLVAPVVLALAVPALADTPAIDYGPAITAAQGQIIATIQSVAPLLITLMAVIAGFGLVFKLISRATDKN
jgi:hypothetical protein